ncbi:hypothetical protein FRB90_004364 [Tulasnella sp. 427]|nr:hypothetical protein FRB90_004364 [Tulasnella sp. 427]
MFSSKFSFNQRRETYEALKRKYANTYETHDIPEPENPWKSFKKNKKRRMGLEQSPDGSGSAMVPGRIQLPSPQTILFLGELPIDIFLEVCLYLTPADLLRLTRLTKTFRAVLLSTQGQYVWSKVYHKYLDWIIPGWPEVKMVAYLFDEHCDECGKLEASRQWDLGTKLCPACLPSKVIDRSLLHKYWPDIPYTVSSTVSYAKACNERLQPQLGQHPQKGSRLPSQRRFGGSIAVPQEASARAQVDPKSEERKKFIDKLKAERKAKRQATKALKRWYEARDPERIKLYARRQEAIAQRLLRDHPRWTIADIPTGDEFKDWTKIVKLPYPFSRAEYRAKKDELVELTWRKISMRYRGDQEYKRWFDMSDVQLTRPRQMKSHHINPHEPVFISLMRRKGQLSD